MRRPRGCQLRPVPIMAVYLVACAPPEVDRLLLVDRTEDGYALVEREVPELTDPWRLEGTIGRGFRGGFLGVEGYREGAGLRIEYDAVDGLGVARYDDGLILWSFYEHLAEIRTVLLDQGHDVAPLFPIDVAWSPVSILDFSAVENAAYSPAGHVFVVFPDLVDEGVPLAANEGVVRHELGHAWFQHLVAPGQMPPPWQEDTTATLSVNALNEGFADMVASLTLDDPDFFAPSIGMPSRDLSLDHVAHEGLYPSSEDSDLLGLLTYDPYALGVVYADLAWDLRLATDPETALSLVVAALQRWAEEADWAEVDRFAVLLVEEAEPAAGGEACASFAAHLPDEPLPEVCP